MMIKDVTLYPAKAAERDSWILSQRQPRNAVDANIPYAFLVEDERSLTGEMVPVATILLTNRECPWRCVMCDLWRNTLSETVPKGAIPAQIKHALGHLPVTREIKLYNSGSFFDPKAIPISDYSPIAKLVNSFDRVIVECHPMLVGAQTIRFRDLLSGQLEVAMGLETVHPQALEGLNKRMTTAQYRDAADFLRSNDIDLRAFVLVQPPFVPLDEALDWVQHSIDFAFDCGATAVTIIPTRGGNGGMESLQATGAFTPPSLSMVEAAISYGQRLKRGRVFVDLWDIDTVAGCTACRKVRIQRLTQMNASQIVAPLPGCEVCGTAA